MSTTLLFDRDPVTRSVELFHYDHTNDKFYIESKQDVTALIENNKAVQNDDSGTFAGNRKSEMRRVASIPLNVLYDLKRQWREQGLSWEERQAAMKRWLNDPDNRFFRTDSSRV
jgi:hypothetical protein